MEVRKGPAEADWDAAAWFFEHGADGFVIVREGLIERVNAAWSTLTGWPAEESLGRRFADFLHEEELAATNGQGGALGPTAGVSLTREVRLRSRAKGWLWMRAQATRLQDGRALLALHDVTAERQRLDEVEQARRVAALLAQAAGIQVYRYDPVTDISVADALIAGAEGPRTEIAAGSWRESVHPEDLPVVERAFELTRRSGQVAGSEYRIQVEGEWRRIRSTWQGVARRAFGEWEVLVITQDVTDLADARDAAMAAADAKSQFLANISHEIRTPLNGLLGVMHVLKGRPMSAPDLSMIKEALACGAMLSQLLDDVIDFSKLEAGEVEFAPEPVDLASSLEAVAGMLRPDADARGLYLEVEASAGAGWARLDPNRLRQMVFNLLVNAVKFTEEGGVRVRLATRLQGERQRLRIEVADTGVGISIPRQASLFHRFQQGDGSTTRRFGGSGLGLAATKALVERMRSHRLQEPRGTRLDLLDRHTGAGLPAARRQRGHRTLAQRP